MTKDPETILAFFDFPAELGPLRTSNPIESVFANVRASRSRIERIIIVAPDSCPCCGSAKLSKLGEDISVPPGEGRLAHVQARRKS